MGMGVAVMRVALGAATIAGADDDSRTGDGPCSAITQAALKACRYGVQDDCWVAVGKCINVSNAPVG